jgi:hypothetical protein
MLLINDGRVYTERYDSPAYKKEYSIDFSLATPYTRAYFQNEPFGNVSGRNPGPQDPATFMLSHYPNKWYVFPSISPPDPVVVGTKTTTRYIWNDGTLAWDVDTVTNENISLRFILYLYGGGDPVSRGRGTGGDDNKTIISFYLDPSPGGAYPDFGEIRVKRFPWDNSWASESALFSTAFSDFIDTNNAFYGGGFSGSCSLSLNFTIP